VFVNFSVLNSEFERGDGGDLIANGRLQGITVPTLKETQRLRVTSVSTIDRLFFNFTAFIIKFTVAEFTHPMA
jgi:hypothetical protein